MFSNKKFALFSLISMGVLVVIGVAIWVGTSGRNQPPEADQSKTTTVDQTKHEPVKVSLGIATWPGFAAGIVGMEKGFFNGIELEHRILDDAPARHAAFQSGAIDIMISSIDVFAQEAAQGIEGKIILVTDESFGGDGIVSRTDIATPSQLKGKKVAFARATPSHYFLYKVLKKHGLSPSDIEQVVMDDPGNAAQAFLGGSVDAAVTWEPFLFEVQDKGAGHVLATTKDYPGIIVDVLLASEDLSRDQALIKSFIEGWLRSVQFISEHPDEAAGIIAEGLNVESGDVQGMMAGLRFADSSLNMEYFAGGSASETKIYGILGEASEFWMSQGIIDEVAILDNLLSGASIEFFNTSR